MRIFSFFQQDLKKKKKKTKEKKGKKNQFLSHSNFVWQMPLRR